MLVTDLPVRIVSQSEETTALQYSVELSPWWVAPFVIFLLMIATGPIFYARFWHRYYAYISIGIASVVVAYYVFSLHHGSHVIHTAVEYVQFISLLTGLYFASSSMCITISKRPLPYVNVLFLLLGGLIANIIGTTGASILLIRPFMLLNRTRIRPYHIVFFIFIVSNVGGALTPIGDPPLFLGFLKGVPFFWTLEHNFFAWCFAMAALLGIFYVIDSYNVIRREEKPSTDEKYSGKVYIHGKRNFFWLLLIIGAVFLDPNIVSWVPYISYEGEKISFLRELIILSAALFSYLLASKRVLLANKFSFFPIKEVALIFIGIFGTMMPALELVSSFSSSEMGQALISPSSLYWGTGFLSGFLDNAPTYITFFAAAMASHGQHITDSSQVLQYAQNVASIPYLQAISLSAVFFGAMTYIGNGPNFMVRSIAQQEGIQMPYFFTYIVRYSIPILVPVCVLVWLWFVM